MKDGGGVNKGSEFVFVGFLECAVLDEEENENHREDKKVLIIDGLFEKHGNYILFKN